MLYFDCFAGAAGDMVLGAFLDLGLPLDALRGALGSLAIEYGDITSEKVVRAGITATKFRLHEPPPPPDTSAAGAPEGHHHHHSHHHLKHIVAAIHRSSLSPEGRDRAIHLFERLAEAEAAIHNTPIEKVHLHEVGALDSIIDIVGSVFAFEWFGVSDIVVSPLNVGGGTVTCAHGVLPVPAPATARLLTGVPVYSKGATEMLTPTGALLLTGYAREYGPMPAIAIERIGYGAGDRDVNDTPNVLRIIKGDRAAAWGGAPAEDETIVKMECEIDDMNPQLFGPLIEALLAAGALDVFYTPVQMKKNRPGTLVTILTPPATRQAVSDVLFRESTTIGVRYAEVSRTCLDRAVETVSTPYGDIRFKVARRDGVVLNAAPEFDDCLKAARQHGVSVKEVQAAAIRAGYTARSAGL